MKYPYTFSEIMIGSQEKGLKPELFWWRREIRLGLFFRKGRKGALRQIFPASKFCLLPSLANNGSPQDAKDSFDFMSCENGHLVSLTKFFIQGISFKGISTKNLPLPGIALLSCLVVQNTLQQAEEIAIQTKQF